MWINWLFLVINGTLLVILATTFVFKRAAFTSPWDGPTVATIALSAAGVILTAVAIGVALLSIWGYNSLREHAENVAQSAATVAADKAADRRVAALLKEWGLSAEAASGEEIAKAYEQEGASTNV